MKTVVIIPAGGSGSRMGNSIPKQYALLRGIPMLAYTIQTIQNTQSVNDIFLILPEGDLQKVKMDIIDKFGFSKVRRLLAGGRLRQDSVRKGIEALEEDHDIVVIHDGVRPFVSSVLLELTIKAAVKDGAVTVGVPSKDTVKSVDSSGYVEETLDRSKLWLTHTPQAFKSSLIKEAYKIAYQENYYANDDAELIERMGIKVNMLLGSYDNIKITTQSDLLWGEIILSARDGGFGSV